MRTKTNQLVISFHTTAEAMAMDRLCRQKGLPGRLIPVPRQISAGCGMAWRAAPEYEELLRKEVTEAGIETAGYDIIGL